MKPQETEELLTRELRWGDCTCRRSILSNGQVMEHPECLTSCARFTETVGCIPAMSGVEDRA